jgi:hypothetical protein
MSSPHALLAELDRELPATRRVIERLPDDRLDWRPHPKSMSAGQLAQHIASIPGGVAGFARGDGLDVSTRPADYAACASVSAALASLDASAAAMRGLLSELDTERAQAPWRLSYRDRELFTMPRIEVVRTMGASTTGITTAASWWCTCDCSASRCRSSTGAAPTTTRSARPGRVSGSWQCRRRPP